MKALTIFWFRRDLRINDNAGLYKALKLYKNVLPIFIFDKNILNKLDDKKDARVSFIHQTITDLSNELTSHKAGLQVFYGKPIDIWKQLIKKYQIKTVVTNRDYESYALDRDAKVEELLNKHDIRFKTYKDHVIFEKLEITKDDGLPYTVFTPYKRKWLKALDGENGPSEGSTLGTLRGSKSYYLKSYPCEKYYKNFSTTKASKIPSLKSMNFEQSDIEAPSTEVKRGLIKKYTEQRNFPAIEGTSRLGIHFRFGTISIREKARKAMGINQTFLSELIWRDFYSQILANFPKVENNAFRAKYEAIEWVNNEAHFKKWCQGNTGYPLVDAGMRELNHSGHMHNRVRMVVASFLTKHLLIDWRWGEAYFAKKLLDFDLASNNGGWQWASGSGTDAAPYFRIFNPTSQLEKFDKKRIYVKRWVPEYGTEDYPEPIVDHKFARERCLARYKEALNKAN